MARFPEVGTVAASPLERWDVPSGSVWVKRDDLLGEGGTKLRKLLVELPLARACRERVVTFGYLDSNHALATARWGEKWGVPVELQLLGRPSDDPARAALVRSVAPTSFHAGVLGLGLGTLWRMVKARLRRERLLVLPPGGTTPRSTAAVAAAVAEVVDQFGAFGEEIPDHWAVAVGSGGTMAGLLAGARAMNLGVQIHGVAASSRWVGPWRVARLANQALRLLGYEIRVQAAEADVTWHQFGGGHGRPAAESQHMLREMAERGHELDPLFTARALAWLESEVRPGENWLFWHTGIGAGAR